ncbi:DUF6708 domain-containing protein [Caldimonas brevitalea]|uniref:DUF6708 domain-containing protein n=1 Tax=Caldimonas brevitalea TaxID=413882 RepID=A0A0G3BLL7_9BURK|nr:DUF6708 domain-containing protein [Caldimonas brevitalea]AKJ30334.1 hypothetical protein AAW51_3643 [Caldimonas brevitalea]
MTNYIRRRASEQHPSGAGNLEPDSSEVNRLDKRKATSATPRSLGLLQRVYEQAIALEAASTRTRGIASVMALMLIPVGVLGLLLLDGSVELVRDSIRDKTIGAAILALAVGVVSLLLFLFSLTAGIRTLRIDLFSPLGMPILLNRKTGKVYRFIQDMPGTDFRTALVNMKYWPGVFKPWPLILIEYDWDCLEAEYAKETRLSGNVVQTLHELRFVAKESKGSARVVDGFTVASPLILGSDTWPQLWEFIRRYMEEQSLAPLDEASFAPEPPKTLLQVANAVAPAGWIWAVAGSVGTAWIALRSGLPEGTLAGVTWLLVAASSNILLGTVAFNWLAHRLAPRVELPADILAEAGAPVERSKITIKASAK